MKRCDTELKRSRDSEMKRTHAHEAVPRGAIRILRHHPIVSISDKPTALWIESDLRELVAESVRENPRLEFKSRLSLTTSGEKNEAERDAMGMANAGGGHIVYGIDEGSLEDGSIVAASLSPLQDGGLYEQLNNVLDSRGDPKLSFDLHALPCESGGIYLVLEVFGHRRPHMDNDGRYHLRRNLLVRRMTEAEVADAYRDRLRRELAAGAAMLGPAGPDPLDEADRRPHRGLKPGELAMYVAEGGDSRGPGWMSVVVGPAPLQPDLLDPTVVKADQLQALSISERWNSEAPLTHFWLRPSLQGFHAALPSRDDVAPAYLVHLWPDGLMEFGTTLEPALRSGDDQHNRIIASRSVADYAHDYTLLFLAVLRHVGYAGVVKAQIAFDNVKAHRLGVERGRAFPQMHPIAESKVEGPVLSGSVHDIEREVPMWVRHTLERLFLAGGIPSGPYFLGPDGRPLSD